MAFVNIFSSFLAGIRDSVSIHNAALFILTSKTIRMRAFQCFLMNGVIFLGSILLTDWFVGPFLRTIVSDGDSAAGSEVHLFDTVFSAVLLVFWIYPIYVISSILNMIWYQDIAEHTFVVHGHKIKKSELSFAKWLTLVAELIYSSMLSGFFIVQISLLGFMPHVGKLLAGLHFCWYYAFTAFEYKWSLERWDLERKLNFFESHWPYFAGFGFPLTLLIFIVPYWVFQGIFALTFPMFIILAVVAKPRNHFKMAAQTANSNTGAEGPPSTPSFLQRLPIFRQAKFLNSLILRSCCRVAPHESTIATTSSDEFPHDN